MPSRLQAFAPNFQWRATEVVYNGSNHADVAGETLYTRNEKNVEINFFAFINKIRE